MKKTAYGECTRRPRVMSYKYEKMSAVRYITAMNNKNDPSIQPWAWPCNVSELILVIFLVLVTFFVIVLGLGKLAPFGTIKWQLNNDSCHCIFTKSAYFHALTACKHK